MRFQRTRVTGFVLPPCRPAADAIFADSIPSGELPSLSCLVRRFQDGEHELARLTHASLPLPPLRLCKRVHAQVSVTRFTRGSSRASWWLMLWACLRLRASCTCLATSGRCAMRSGALPDTLMQLLPAHLVPLRCLQSIAFCDLNPVRKLSVRTAVVALL
jgi:hypothetical protein